MRVQIFLEELYGAVEVARLHGSDVRAFDILSK